MKVKVGMGQILVEGGEPTRNLQRAVEMIDRAVEEGCHIALLPETLDLAWTHPSSQEEAEPIPGKYSQILCDKAKSSKIWVCAGLTEKAEDKIYNSAVLINDSGEIVHTHRKINVLDVGLDFYAIGTELKVVDTPFGKVGVNICADNYMDGLPIGHTLARMGAQIILSPSSWTIDYTLSEGEDIYGEKWLKPYSTLAKLYDLTILGTTSVGYIVGGPYEGKKMGGCSLAVDPSGVIAQGEMNEISSVLIPVEFEVQDKRALGSNIGKECEQRGFLSERFALPSELKKKFKLPFGKWGKSS